MLQNVLIKKINQMKKSLAPRRQIRPLPMNAKKPSPRGNTSISNEDNQETKGRELHEKNHGNGQYEQKYRNKKINSITVPLLVTISGLNTLDISYNNLNDSQIELVMNSCIKLVSLCIQGNINTIIPAALFKLKQLINFKHDWLRLVNGCEDSYEPSDRLLNLKSLIQKHENVVKVNKIVGMDFQFYSREIAYLTFDSALIQKIEKQQFQSNVKEALIKIVKQCQNSKAKPKAKPKTLNQRGQFLTCNITCGFDNLSQKRLDRFERCERPDKPASVYPKKQSTILQSKDISEAETDVGSRNLNIKIQDIRDISESQLANSLDLCSDRGIGYTSPGMPIHELLGNFDSNPLAASQIDALLLKGYNPNQLDSNGLSPYHVCLIQNQKKGFEYLMCISGKNPGFFDLQISSQKDYRNILHYCAFIKNYNFAKQLIQFGFPTDKRDSTGHRIIHLVDQNYEFLLLLRKLLKKTTALARTQGNLTTMQFKKKYVKHPARAKQQAKFRIAYSNNDKLLELYEAAMNPMQKIQKVS